MLRIVLPALVLLASSSLQAQDPPPKLVQPRVQPAQPGGLQPAVQPNPFRTVPATTMARYEEEAEVLEAQLNVKKAYIQASDVAVAGAKIKYEHTQKLFEQKAISSNELQLGKLEVDAANAQLAIRMAEMKEVEVRLKFAKKRLEDGKAGVRPAPAPRADPKPIDPRQ